MQLFINNLITGISALFGKRANLDSYEMWWVQRDESTFKEVKIMKGWSTMIYVAGTKHQVRMRRGNNNVIYRWQRSETGVKILDNGTVKMWSKSGCANFTSITTDTAIGQFKMFTHVAVSDKFEKHEDFYGVEHRRPDLGLFGRDRGRLNTVVAVPVVDAFVAHHGASSLENLLVPAKEMLSLTADDITARFTSRPWVDRILGARDSQQFWALVGKKQLAKDEKRALINAIKVNPKYIEVARIATRISIPNIRDLVAQNPDRWGIFILDSNQLSLAIGGLRLVPPHRRLMFMQAWASTHTFDALRGLAELKREGFDQVLNYPTIEEYHQRIRIIQRQLATAKREIEMKALTAKKEVINGQMIGDIRVVVPRDTHEVIEWGETQNHCIGSYANQAAQGRVILLGFWRNGWVGHCSITSREVDQLLAKNNTRLAYEDYQPIMEWLKEQDLIDKAYARWGHVEAPAMLADRLGRNALDNRFLDWDEDDDRY